MRIAGLDGLLLARVDQLERQLAEQREISGLALKGAFSGSARSRSTRQNDTV